MKCLINNLVVLSRVPEGPLAAYIEPFAEHIRAQGYALNSIHQQVRLVAAFSRWLKPRDVGVRSINSDHLRR